MTVQELIDKLQQIEDKSLSVVISDYEIGFCDIDKLLLCKVPKSFDPDYLDGFNEEYIDAIIISY